MIACEYKWNKYRLHNSHKNNSKWPLLHFWCSSHYESHFQTEVPCSRTLSVWRWTERWAIALQNLMSPCDLTQTQPHWAHIQTKVEDLFNVCFLDTWIIAYEVESALPTCTPSCTLKKPLHFRNSFWTLELYFPESLHSLWKRKR